MEVFQIFGLWDQEIDLWFTNHGPLIPTLHILKSSASMCESSGSIFFRATTGIQSGPDAFDELRFVMTLLTILGVTEILCSFRLVLEGKTGKEIESSRFKFLERFLANNFTLWYGEDNTSELLNRGGIADLPMLRTLLVIPQKLWEPSFWEKMYCFVLLAYAILAALRTILQQSLPPELSFRFSRFILWVHKKVISMNYGSCTSSWKLWR